MRPLPLILLLSIACQPPAAQPNQQAEDPAPGEEATTNALPNSPLTPTGPTEPTGNVSMLATLSSPAVSLNEGMGPALITVSLNHQVDEPIVLTVTTINGTALAGSDYTAVSTTLTILAGSISDSVSVPFVDDNSDEDNESFTVRFTLASASMVATLPNPLDVNVTIIDNDGLPPAPTGMPRAWILSETEPSSSSFQNIGFRDHIGGPTGSSGAFVTVASAGMAPSGAERAVTYAPAPDGQHLAYGYAKGPTGTPHLHIMPAAALPFPPIGGVPGIDVVMPEQLQWRPNMENAHVNVNDRHVSPFADFLWSPDGQYVAFVVETKEFETPEFQAQLWVASVDGSLQRLLTDKPHMHGEQAAAAWSRDGQMLAFIQGATGPTGLLRVLDASANDVFTVGVPLPGLMPDQAELPVWHPLEHKLAFLGLDHNSDGSPDVCVVSAPNEEDTGACGIISTKSDPQNLPRNITWSTFGNYVSYLQDDSAVSGGAPEHQLVRVRPNPLLIDRQVLSFYSGVAYGHAWLPGESGVIYTQQKMAGGLYKARLFFAEKDGSFSDNRELGIDVAGDDPLLEVLDFAVSADGTSVAYVWKNGVITELHLADVATANSGHAISDPAHDAFTPQWSPYEDRLVYQQESSSDTFIMATTHSGVAPAAPMSVQPTVRVDVSFSSSPAVCYRFVNAGHDDFYFSPTGQDVASTYRVATPPVNGSLGQHYCQ